MLRRARRRQRRQHGRPATSIYGLHLPRRLAGRQACSRAPLKYGSRRVGRRSRVQGCTASAAAPTRRRFSDRTCYMLEIWHYCSRAPALWVSRRAAAPRVVQMPAASCRATALQKADAGSQRDASAAALINSCYGLAIKRTHCSTRRQQQAVQHSLAATHCCTAEAKLVVVRSVDQRHHGQPPRRQ